MYIFYLNNTSENTTTASSSIGKTIEEAKDILENYDNMIEEKPYNKDILKEALVYDDIYKQPSRKTCATLATRGLSKLLDQTTEK